VCECASHLKIEFDIILKELHISGTVIPTHRKRGGLKEITYDELKKSMNIRSSLVQTNLIFLNKSWATKCI
jgi:hypothetical protein